MGRERDTDYTARLKNSGYYSHVAYILATPARKRTHSTLHLTTKYQSPSKSSNWPPATHPKTLRRVGPHRAAPRNSSNPLSHSPQRRSQVQLNTHRSTPKQLSQEDVEEIERCSNWAHRSHWLTCCRRGSTSTDLSPARNPPSAFACTFYCRCEHSANSTAL